MTRSPSILLIDDHALFRSGMRMLLTSHLPSVDIIEAESLTAVFPMVTDRPDMVLLDIVLPGINGLYGVSIVHKYWPGCPVIMLSSHVDQEKVQQAVRAGAQGFVTKAESVERIIAVIDAVLTGHDSTAAFPVSVPRKKSKFVPESVPELTSRQLEVLGLMSEGLSNKLIGRRLSLSENTVRCHVQAILTSLEAVSRSEAVAVAHRKGLVH